MGKPRWGYSSNSKSNCSCSSFSCSRLYLRMVSSSNPTVLTQYLLAQKCRPDTRFLPKILRWIKTALLPIKNPITNAILYFGATLSHIWMWSGLKCPASNSTPRWRNRSRNISPTQVRNFPYNFFSRYLDTNTTWYLQSHLTCDKLVQSCIGNSSSLPFGAFPEELPILFLTGSVEPIRVLHQRWRV